MKLLEKIVLATDFSKSSENTVENAIVLAKAFDSKISLIHVLSDGFRNEGTEPFIKDAAIKQLEAIREKMISEKIKTDEPILEYGNISDRIIKTAHNLNANVILIGAGEKQENDAFQLGITAGKIIRKSDKPVWVIKNNSSLSIKNILCPVDFSTESKRALRNAISLTRRFKAKLLIFNVYKIDYPTALSSKMNWDKEDDRKASVQVKDFNLFLKEFDLKDLNWDKEIKGGDPATEIRRAITRYKSDLNIMGTSGKTDLSRFIMGSVTEKVIREVPCSFITLKSKDIIDLKLETRIRDIQKHYVAANQLIKDGFFEESIFEFEICLRINSMHLPSLNGIAKVYEKLGDIHNTEKYKNISKEILERIWDGKVESKIRKHYKL